MTTSERIVGEHTIGGRRVHVVETTWRGKPGQSYDLADAESGETLTLDESFDAYPTHAEMAQALKVPWLDVEYGDVLSALRNGGFDAAFEDTGGGFYAVRVEAGAWFLWVTTEGVGGLATVRTDHRLFEVGRFHAEEWSRNTDVGTAETVDELVALVSRAISELDEV